MTSESMESLREKIAFCKEKKSKLVISYHDIEDLEPLLLLRDSGIDFICEDMPEANTETLGIMILIAGGAYREDLSKCLLHAVLLYAKDTGRNPRLSTWGWTD